MNENKFASIAKKETTLSFIMEGREKVKMDEIMRAYPDGVTIIGFDFINGTDNKGNPTTFPVLAFAEDQSKCFFGGAVLSKICAAWLAGGDDTEAVSIALRDAGGVRMKFRETKTRTGNNLIAVDVL